MSASNQIDAFSDEVCEALQAYVYRLVDPRTGETFYVGKGRGARAFNHAKLAVTSEESLRFDLIRRIRSAGLDPIVIIHRHGLDDESAYEVEAALMDAYPGLSNEVGGHGRDRGTMSPYEVVDRYGAPPAEIRVPSILIKIEREWRPNLTAVQLYEATRKWWVCNPERRPTPPRYAISIARGLIREVYEIDRWENRLPTEDAPPLDPAENPDGSAPSTQVRKGFIGRVATDTPLRQSLLRKSIRQIPFGKGNPIAYVGCG